MDSNNQDRVTRRQFLQSLGLVGIAGAGGSLLVACGGSESSGNGSGGAASASCSDLSGLSDQQKKQRQQMVKSLSYVEETPNPEKNCGNCQLYQREQYGSGCGGCQLFPGPVAEQGYCDSWAPKA